MVHTRSPCPSSLFPLHWLIWHDDPTCLKLALDEDSSKERIEKKDPRGRTPLMLAVTLDRIECAMTLLSFNADTGVENGGFWSLSHEAVSTCDPELLMAILQHRDMQRMAKTSKAMTELLMKLKDTPDFYAEMQWEFSSWVPFVSKMCPSDTYKIYKLGSSVRIDTTLVGFDSSSNWERGRQSYIFSLESDEDDAQSSISTTFTIVDHEKRRVSVEKLAQNEICFDDFRPSESAILDKLTSPIVTTYVDVDKIGFERSRGGWLSWILNSQNKNELVAGFQCKVLADGV